MRDRDAANREIADAITATALAARELDASNAARLFSAGEQELLEKVVGRILNFWKLKGELLKLSFPIAFRRVASLMSLTIFGLILSGSALAPSSVKQRC